MSASAQVVEDYGKTAPEYKGIEDLPQGVLEAQLIASAIGNASGLTVLDIGGGSGIHARQAVNAGAKRVDIVDITSEMLKVAQDIETSLGRQDRIWCHQADVSKPLDHLPLDKQYDIVMANWVFDHAGSVEELEGMWHNVSTYLRPGGKFLGIRVADLSDLATLTNGESGTPKYGTTFKDFRPIPGGVGYTVTVHTDVPFDFEATSIEISSSGSLELHHKYGLVDVGIVPYKEMDVVKKHIEFWHTFLEAPFFAVVQGKKKLA